MAKVMGQVGNLTVTLLGGAIAGAVFKRVWRVGAGGQEAPDARDLDRRLREVMLAAAIHGVILAMVRAALQRGGSAGKQRVSRHRET